MNHALSVSHDLRELLARINPDNLVPDAPKGKPDILATALTLPTLAERGEQAKALLLARVLIERRDPDGGWDDPWTTVFVLEAFISLKLRGISFDGLDDVLLRAIRVLRDQSPLSPVEHDLRLARTLVLAGLALQDSKGIDAGMMRARSVLDRGFTWSPSIGTRLHALLALADLSMVTKDVATADLVTKALSNAEMIESIGWADKESVEIVTRAGIVLEKMGFIQRAEELYQSSVEKEKASTLPTIALKHRIELGARLLSRAEAVKPSNPEPTQTSTRQKPKTEIVSKVESGENGDALRELFVEELPALQPGIDESPRVSVLVVQMDSGQPVEETLLAVSNQGVQGCEVIVVGDSFKGKTFADVGMPVTVVNVPSATIPGRRLKLALDAAQGDWIWIVPAGVQPVGEALSAMLVGSERTDVVHLSAFTGQAAKARGDLHVQPTVRPEHLLVRRAIVRQSPRTAVWHGRRPWWPFIVENLLDVSWNEVIHPNLDATDAAAHDLQPDISLLEEIPGLYRAFPSRDPEERKRRRVILDERRAEVYATCRTDNQPLASILIAGDADQAAFLRTMQAVIENTETIPFEVIAVLEPGLAKEVGAALERLGVLLLDCPDGTSQAEKITLAVEKAQGRYLILLNNTVEVHAGWLPALVHASCEENAGIAGAFIQQEHGKVHHAGIAFDSKGEPVRLHFGKTTLLKSLYQRRFFQAVDGDLALVRRDWWQSLHGFSNEIDSCNAFLDLSLRARYQGCRIVYEPDVRGTILIECKPPEIPENWYELHGGRVQTDVNAYAHLDGYRVEGEHESARTIPLGRVVPTSAEAEETIMKTGVAEGTGKAGLKQPSAPLTLPELLTWAETQIKDGRFDVAEEALVKARQQVNGNVRSRVMYWTLLGDARFRLNKSEDAYSCYRKAVSDDPSAERAWIGIGTYHLVKDELEEADQIFSKVVELNPGNLRGHLGKGNVELRRGQSDDALQCFLKAIDLEPGYRPAIVGLVAAAVQAERMNDAEPPLVRYLAIHPDDFEARFQLAAVLFGNNETDRARSEAVRVLETKPEHKGARELLSHIPGEPSAS